MGGLQYLSGYVVRKFLKKAKNSPKYLCKENQTIINILQNIITYDLTNQELIKSQTRGGLTAVTDECQKIFLRAEETFRSETMTNKHLQQIDIRKMISSLMNNTEVVSFFNTLAETGEGDPIEAELKYNLLEGMLKLYLRVRAFSLARDITDKHKFSAKKNKAKALRKGIKKGTNKLDVVE